MHLRPHLHALGLATALVLATGTASASPDDEQHVEQQAHGEAHGEEHGGAHHISYTLDDDGDGTANWRDSDAEEAYVLDKLIFHAINLLLLFGILFWAVRRPAADFIRERALLIRKRLTDTKALRDDAEKEHAEIEARLAKITDEVANMRARAQTLAEKEHADLVARSHLEAERIAKTAQRNIRDEVVRARNTLRQEAVELAVQLAESTLRDAVNQADQQKLARQFLSSLNNEGDNADA